MTALDRDLTKSELRGALRESEARIDAVLALHHPDSDGSEDPICCSECGSWWSDQGMAGYSVRYPCPTIRALKGEA